jgi:hypothetical protein
MQRIWNAPIRARLPFPNQIQTMAACSSTKMRMRVLIISLGLTITSACVPYKNYFEDLDYCADPLYWSNYPISSTSATNIDTYEATALTDYELIRDGIWYNTELLDDTGIDRSKLIDCMGMAQRIACHGNIPRCSKGSTDRSLCKGMCKLFHDRCTIDNVDYIQRGLGSSYTYYTCEGLPDSDCSPASRSATLSPLVLCGMVLLSMLALMR